MRFYESLSEFEFDKIWQWQLDNVKTLKIITTYHQFCPTLPLVLPSRHYNGKENAPQTAVFAEFEPWVPGKICRVRRNVVSLHRQTKKGGLTPVPSAASPPCPSPRGEGSKMKAKTTTTNLNSLYVLWTPSIAQQITPLSPWRGVRGSHPARGIRRAKPGGGF